MEIWCKSDDMGILNYLKFFQLLNVGAKTEYGGSCPLPQCRTARYQCVLH